MTNNINRGLYTDVIDIRRKVFVESARLILSNDYHNVDKLKIEFQKVPGKIIPSKDPTYRCCVYKERAIVGERLRVSLGLPLRKGEIDSPVYQGLETALSHQKIVTEEIVNVIPDACEKCPTEAYKVTDNCRKCLAHPCSVVCPVNAISFNSQYAVIDQEKCINCGRCKTACPYDSITHYDRPCAAACGVDAIDSDESNRAVINQEKCVKCGMCIVACPFGAIVDKSEFVQLLIAIEENKKVYAIIAPSFIGQFGPRIEPGQIINGIKKIGFDEVMEVAFGADVATNKEGEEWLHRVKEGKFSFLGTSCCPSWVDMALQDFPEIADNISGSYTPMKASAMMIKKNDPEALVCFIGPCIAKKSESTRPEVREEIDYVITFEELASILVAKDIELSDLESLPLPELASKAGRNYPVSGGVAHAVYENIRHLDPEAEVLIDKRDSLKECKKMIKEVLLGKNKANLIEGMACPGGCVGGAGILTPINRTTRAVGTFAESSQYHSSYQNPHTEEVQ
ncbi:MAG: 4Fe-4S dicluster domain-containing protein [Spirochaetales bacterium]|nr:4Fe-4S dicluster domain-containing protein [Spirochaetales bacterium]